MLAFFGQVVSAEILLASENGCPLEIHHIPIEKCDEMYDKECDGEKAMPFYRANYDHKTGQSPNMPREQVRSKKLNIILDQYLIQVLFFFVTDKLIRYLFVDIFKMYFVCARFL